MDAEVAHDHRAELGEGPVWLGDRLAWVDIPAGELLVAAPDLTTVERQRVDVPLGAALPLAGDGWLLAAGTGFAHLDGTVELLAQPEAPRRATVRMNDAACDPAGRAWAGSMAYDERPRAGSLFRVDLDGTVTRVLTGRTISNGLGWSPDGRTCYYADTGDGVVYRTDYDVDRGLLGPLEPLIEAGTPDGLTVDAEGALWVALWGEGAVQRYAATGRPLERVRVPAPNTTSCCHGGPDGRTLFITTARSEEPESGKLFAVRVDVPGPPAARFRGALPH
jgi:sugar lactone lactonase YvrE